MEGEDDLASPPAMPRRPPCIKRMEPGIGVPRGGRFGTTVRHQQDLIIGTSPKTCSPGREEEEVEGHRGES
jgi:hypothetical protein